METAPGPQPWSPLLAEGPRSSGKALSPLEETHDETEVEEGIKCEKETVPQARPRIEGAEVQIVVVTDTTNYCRQQDEGGGQSWAGAGDLGSHLPTASAKAPWM